MKYRHLFTHPFVTDNFWYGLSSLLVNIVNYSFLLMIMHFLSKNAFGAFSALVSLLTLVAFLANPLQLYVTKDVMKIRPRNLREYFVQGSEKIVKYTGGMFLVLAALTPHLSSALNVSGGNLIFVWLIAAAMILAIFANGVSAGLKKLTFQASLNFFTTVAKFILAWFLLTAGQGISAGLSGYFASFVLMIGVTWSMLGRWEASEQANPAREERQESIVVLLLAYLFVAVPFSLDQIFVQVLNTKLSGDYAALATLGKLVFFASSPFQVVLYAYLVKARHDRALQMKYFLSGSLASVGAAFLVSALLGIGGRTLVGLLLPSTYLDVSDWVFAYSLGICGYVFSYSIVLLGIVRNDPRIVGLISLATLAQVVLFSLRNATLAQVVTNQIMCLSLMCVASIIYLLLGHPPQGGDDRTLP